jgi:hypothetical protein
MNGRVPMGYMSRERGTALVIAMLLLVILTALGVYAVSISTSELEMANYTRAGRSALNASEAGAYFGIDTLPVMTNAAGIALSNDASYDIATTTQETEVIPGYDTGWVRAIFNVRSTGYPPSVYAGMRMIDAGASYGPVPSGTGY